MNESNLPKTEQTLPKSQWIDKLSLNEAVELIINNQIESVKAIKNAINDIKNAINKITKKIQNNSKSRIVYIGAGTSGRLGILDGVELSPTFGWDNSRLVFILAGGKSAMFKSSENAEDNEKLVLEEIERKKISKDDVVIGISASGFTKFTVNGILKAKEIGALTVGISNNENSSLLKTCEIPIFLDSCVEVISGSTRMAAGTTQKICLNILSTILMTNLGKVKNSEMIKMKPTNKKLYNRHLRIQKNL